MAQNILLVRKISSRANLSPINWSEARRLETPQTPKEERRRDTVLSAIDKSIANMERIYYPGDDDFDDGISDDEREAALAMIETYRLAALPLRADAIEDGA